MKQFYYVHNRATGNPTCRHTTFLKAKDEAIRLSKKMKKSFYILASVAKVVYQEDGEPVIESEGKLLDKESVRAMVFRKS